MKPKLYCSSCGKYPAKWLTGHGKLCGHCRNYYWRHYLRRIAERGVDEPSARHFVQFKETHSERSE